ncbi:MAG: hypothetical protein IJG33_15510 [Selenomonadaceae bacterium]|nr:hypothetical protein [Selenomonadaceae bacterium]
MDKKIKRAAGVGLAALAIVVAGGGYYHFHVDTDTPNFAIKTIEQSIKDHDPKTFHSVVNVDGVLASGYDGFVEVVTSPDVVTMADTRDVIKDFTQMLRDPMLMSLKAAIDSYVATGNFDAEKNAGVVELLDRMGLKDAEVRDVRNVQINDANRNEAFADLIIFQPELDREFPIQFVLTRNEDKWQVSRVQNFKDYVEQIAQARRAQLDDYLRQSSEINNKHEATLREAEKKYGAILSTGNLSEDKTRAELKALMNDTFKKDWEEHKQELFSLRVPKEAETLHNLYMKICDTAIDAAQTYSKWIDDRNPETIKSAEEKIHQVQTLITEAATIAKRMTS